MNLFIFFIVKIRLASKKEMSKICLIPFNEYHRNGRMVILNRMIFRKTQIKIYQVYLILENIKF